MAKKATNKTGKKGSKKEEKTSKSPRMLTNPEIEEDKDFRDLLPPLALDVRKALEESIRDEGLRDPLIGWRENGILVLVDGYNRFKFCKKHGKDYRVIVKSFNDREEVKQWMWENQESRRNMTPYQRIEVVLKFKGVVREQAKKNQSAAGGAVSEKFNKAKVSRAKFNQIRTNQVLGERAGVSYPQVGKVKDIQEKIAEGVISKEVLNELREGKVSINRIHKEYCKRQTSKKHSNKDMTERSNKIIWLLKTQVARSFSKSEDCTSLYDNIIEWAKAQKAGEKEASE